MKLVRHSNSEIIKIIFARTMNRNEEISVSVTNGYGTLDLVSKRDL